jgi:uncharacterized protein (TIGR01370 family)
MARRWYKNFLIMLCCLTGCAQVSKAEGIQHWAVYYNNTLPAADFAGLDLVVFDRRYHPDFAVLQPNTLVLAYVSMGEVYEDVPEKVDLENNNLLLFKNKVWNSHAVDLTSPLWRRMVMEYVDDAIARGFDGVMLDTVDSPLAWARAVSPDRCDTMRAAAVNIINEIRIKYPDKKIMLNHGFSILNEAAPDLDYVLAESILTQKDNFTGQFRWLSAKAYADAVAQLHQIIARTEKLQVLTLDYWNVDDGDGVERIYKQQRAHGFIPYVTTPELTRFTPEKPKHEPSAPGV